MLLAMQGLETQVHSGGCPTSTKQTWVVSPKEVGPSKGRPFDPVGEAEAELETLVMAEGSRSMMYFVEFNCLVSRIQWGDHALL